MKSLSILLAVTAIALASPATAAETPDSKTAQNPGYLTTNQNSLAKRHERDWVEFVAIRG